MRSLLFGFFFFVIWALGARYYYVCQIKGLCGNAVTVVDARSNTLQLKYGEEVILDGYNEFAYDHGRRLPNLNTNNDEFLDKLAEHLKAHPEHGVTITGNYLENEATAALSGTFQENLGLARAEQIRNHLVARGVDESRISLDHQIVKGDKLSNPLEFSLFPSGVDEENPEEYSKVQFTFHDMTYSDANFGFDSDVFQPGSAFKLYADSVVTYLGNYEDKTLTIIGHTDNVGNITYNDDLGLRRAMSARKYFEEKGVTSKIKVASRGKREPIAPNDTDANKQKNRRVNLKIE